MPNRGSDDELLKAALSAAVDCPSLEELERLLNEGAPVRLKRHVDGCFHCQTELEMLRAFSSNEDAEHERVAVDSIAARLRARSIPTSTLHHAIEEPRSWWTRILMVRWLTPAFAALALALVIGGVTIELRQGRQPRLDTAVGGADVLRSSAFAVLSPVGDVKEKPAEIRWETAPDAARYRVQIMEVDHRQLWSIETATPRADLPASVEDLIVPTKTLLIQIAAFDASGNKVAESEIARFKLLQNIHTP
jgi:hypothetical protein